MILISNTNSALGWRNVERSFTLVENGTVNLKFSCLGWQNSREQFRERTLSCPTLSHQDGDATRRNAAFKMKALLA